MKNKQMLQKRKPKYSLYKRYSPSPIPQVQQANSTSFDTTANTIKPLQIFDYLQRKRKCYAFQLIKQFFLFAEQSSDQSYSQLQQDHQYDKLLIKKQINLEKAQLHISTMFSVIKRIKQKLLLSAYDQFKKKYFKKKMVYRNKQYVHQIVQKITNLIKQEHQEVLQYVFVELINNLKTYKLKEIMKNDIQHINTPQQIQYQDRTFKTREYLPFHSDQQSGIMKNDTQSFFQSDSRIQIAKDFGLRKLKNQQAQTPHKQPYFQQQLPTTRQRTGNSSSQNKKQLIYIVQTGKKSSNRNKYQPTRHIKIGIQTNNVDIIRIQGQNNYDKSSRKKSSKITKETIYDCSKCQFCKKLQISKQNLTKLKIFN